MPQLQQFTTQVVKLGPSGQRMAGHLHLVEDPLEEGDNMFQLGSEIPSQLADLDSQWPVIEDTVTPPVGNDRVVPESKALHLGPDTPSRILLVL